jgi:hypothetical protein
VFVLAVIVLASGHPAVAQTGADVAASISGKHTVKLGDTITY